MIARPATVADVEHVFGCLAERSRRELDRALLDHPACDRMDVARNVFTTAIENRSCEALVDGDKTLALLALEDENDAVVTSFVAAEAFFHAAHVAFTRRHVRGLQDRVGRELRSYSYSDHPLVTRWFRAIGFGQREQLGNAIRHTRTLR